MVLLPEVNCVSLFFDLIVNERMEFAQATDDLIFACTSEASVEGYHVFLL